MGRRVSIYTLREDEEKLIDFIINNPGMSIVYPTYQSPDIYTIDSYAKIERNTNRELLIWCKSIIIMPEYIKKNQRREYKEDQGIFVDLDGFFYALDGINGPFIQFIRSFQCPDEELPRGSIWAEMKKIENDSLVEKGEEFEDCFNQVVKWIRRNFIWNKEHGAYFGPESLSWISNGGVLHGYP